MADMEDIAENLSEMIRGCETFVAERIAKVETDCEQTIYLSVEAVQDNCKKQIDNMEERFKNIIRKSQEENKASIDKIHQFYDKAIQNLSEKINHQEKCKCKELYEAYVTAGKLVFSNQRFVVVEKDKEPSVAAIVDVSAGEETVNIATESETQDVQPQPQGGEAGEVETEVFGVQSTSPVYTTVKDVPEALRCQIMKYANPKQKSVTTDKLNLLQQMYFHFFMDTKVREDENTADVASRLMGAGIRDKIWSGTFLPVGSTNLLEYLKLRVKNFRFQRKLKKDQASQAERLAGAVSRAKKMKKN